VVTVQIILWVMCMSVCVGVLWLSAQMVQPVFWCENYQHRGQPLYIKWESGFASQKIFLLTLPVPLHTSSHHLSNDDCLEDEREDYQNCSMLCCCVWQLALTILFLCCLTLLC